MLASDSVHLKQWISKSYGLQNANEKVSVDKQRWKSWSIPREIVTTRARGVHSRPGRNPSTADVAEALIDWYLLGESDLVVPSAPGFTFGTTAALRTARPYYDPAMCSKPLPFKPCQHHGRACEKPVSVQEEVEKGY